MRDTVQRLAAEIRTDNAPGDPVAHCEECGVVIPVEYARCSHCEYDEDDVADERYQLELDERD